MDLLAEIEDLRRLIWEARDRHSHPGGTNETSDEDKEICVLSREIISDRFGNRDKQNACYGVTDKCRDDLRRDRVHVSIYNVAQKGKSEAQLRTNTMGDKINTTWYSS